MHSVAESVLHSLHHGYDFEISFILVIISRYFLQSHYVFVSCTACSRRSCLSQGYGHKRSGSFAAQSSLTHSYDEQAFKLAFGASGKFLTSLWYGRCVCLHPWPVVFKGV